MSDDPAELTDEMAVQHWLRIADDTENIFTQTQDPSFVSVRPGSELARDDSRSDPHQVSHCAMGFINSGIDHMHALKTLILGVPVIHADSDYTLIRGALENFGVAFWVLHPSERLVRIERALRCAAQNFRDQDNATKALELPEVQRLQSNLASVSAAGRRAGCHKSKVLRRLNSTAVMQYAGKHTPVSPDPFFAWQICSGFAHGRQWASLGMNAVEITPGPEEGVSTVRFTSDYKRLLGVGLPAHNLMVEVVRLFTERSG